MMRVRDFLNKLDRNKLIRTFFEYAENDLDAVLGVKNLSPEEAEYQKRLVMDQQIQKLADMDITEVENGNTYIILGCPVYRQGVREEGVPDHVLVCKENILEYEENPGCNIRAEIYLTSPQSEMIGFYVSDTKYTQAYIYEIIAQVLYNAVLYGLNQEFLAYEYQDYVQGEIWSAWYKMEDFYGNVLERKSFVEAGLLSLSEDDEDEETSEDEEISEDEERSEALKKLSLYVDIFVAIKKFNEYCLKSEAKQLRECLQQ